MTDIDLIPADYRERLRLHGWGKAMAVIIFAVFVISIASHFTLGYMNKKIAVKILDAKERQKITEEQSNVLTGLNSKKTTLQQQLSFLDSLRSGTEAPSMFKTIDRSLNNDEVWFLNWEFRRAGTTVESKTESSSNGYFIVIQEKDGEEITETWKIETHMTIKGQAKDHAALSHFVRKLSMQPEIDDVRILNTSRSSRARVVNFDLAVTVNSGTG